MGERGLDTAELRQEIISATGKLAPLVRPCDRVSIARSSTSRA
jgi:hypothetical protein